MSKERDTITIALDTTENLSIKKYLVTNFIEFLDLAKDYSCKVKISNFLDTAVVEDNIITLGTADLTKENTKNFLIVTVFRLAHELGHVIIDSTWIDYKTNEIKEELRAWKIARELLKRLYSNFYEENKDLFVSYSMKCIATYVFSTTFSGRPTYSLNYCKDKLGEEI